MTDIIYLFLVWVLVVSVTLMLLIVGHDDEEE
jgi:hypothetical protein